MVGLIIGNQSYIAQTSNPLVVEPRIDYASSKKLLPDRYIAISSKFAYIQESDQFKDFDFPIYPSETIVRTDIIGIDHNVVFAVKNDLALEFKNGSHIIEHLEKVVSNFQSTQVRNIYLICIQNHVVIFMRFQEHLEFVNVLQLTTAEEILFWINRLFRERSLNFEEDQIIIYGEVKIKIEIFEIFAPYFRKIWVENSNPLLSLV